MIKIKELHSNFCETASKDAEAGGVSRRRLVEEIKRLEEDRCGLHTALGDFNISLSNHFENNSRLVFKVYCNDFQTIMSLFPKKEDEVFEQMQETFREVENEMCQVYREERISFYDYSMICVSNMYHVEGAINFSHFLSNEQHEKLYKESLSKLKENNNV